MNAMANSPPPFIQDNSSGSDSDEAPPEYYQPISNSTGNASDDDDNNDDDITNNGVSNFNPLPNGYAILHCRENGVSSLDLSEDDDDEEEEREEEERVYESERSIERAFVEDERRRNAPLPPENASRIVEAMRGVSFGGLAPEWAGRVSEDQLVDRIRRLRGSTPQSSNRAEASTVHD